jgi:acyl-CoA dehydrogenase
MQSHVYPLELQWESLLEQQQSRWNPLPAVESLKQLARSEGLWNLVMPGAEGAGLSNVDYA